MATSATAFAIAAATGVGTTTVEETLPAPPGSTNEYLYQNLQDTAAYYHHGESKSSATACTVINVRGSTARVPIFLLHYRRGDPINDVVTAARVWSGLPVAYDEAMRAQIVRDYRLRRFRASSLAEYVRAGPELQTGSPRVRVRNPPSLPPPNSNPSYPPPDSSTTRETQAQHDLSSL